MREPSPGYVVSVTHLHVVSYPAHMRGKLKSKHVRMSSFSTLSVMIRILTITGRGCAGDKTYTLKCIAMLF